MDKQDQPTTMTDNTDIYTTDASVAEGWAGIAVINSMGDLVVDYCAASSALEGELSAISLALSFASEKGAKRILIESDCSVAVNGLNLVSISTSLSVDRAQAAQPKPVIALSFFASHGGLYIVIGVCSLNISLMFLNMGKYVYGLPYIHLIK
ncbi:hypothetical protein F8388_017940 [Cannabis sativa]|uniref:RNase H type-1 domain-containing protein n=1 Tax=Cannabis sativa TaxID=3483 RepID=A0A7J6HFN1_CANSA|nr:hypothetical protein F8388_017940 [Cannabis sativa]